MSEPHIIRLKGPWQFVQLDGTEGTFKAPAAFAEPGDSATFSRRFNWVAALEPGEAVFVVFTNFGGRGSVSLNGTRLGVLNKPPGEFDITRRLEPGNQLQVAMEFDSVDSDQPRGLFGDVRLEVRREPG